MEIFHKMISAALEPAGKANQQYPQATGRGATIPFISRYRKEITGGLDEVQIEAIKTQYDKLSDLAKRKETIFGTISEQGKLTPELQQRIDATWDSLPLKICTCPTSLNARPVRKPPVRKGSSPSPY